MTTSGHKKVALEAGRMYELYSRDIVVVLKTLSQQMNVLHARAQIIMTLSGVVVTVTGFSGRIIAGTSPLAKASIISGLFVVLASAIWAWSRVMSIKWNTTALDGDPIEIITRVINRRNSNTSAYEQSGIILCSGLLIYGVAVAQMLLFA